MKLFLLLLLIYTINSQIVLCPLRTVSVLDNRETYSMPYDAWLDCSGTYQRSRSCWQEFVTKTVVSARWNPDYDNKYCTLTNSSTTVTIKCTCPPTAKYNYYIKAGGYVTTIKNDPTPTPTMVPLPNSNRLLIIISVSVTSLVLFVVITICCTYYYYKRRYSINYFDL